MTTSARYALEGKVVTMEAAGVLERGVVYVRGRDIVAVQEAGAAPPAGFRDAPLVHSGGTLYPGLIDLCRRPAYSILPLPPLARRFEDRDRWERDPDWERGVAAPLRLLLDAPRCRPALARYHEAACLLAGVTSAPGLIAAAPGTGDA
ncbi:MAG: amidohydrolase, partial [Anaerolineae bacterium]